VHADRKKIDGSTASGIGYIGRVRSARRQKISPLSHHIPQDIHIQLHSDLAHAAQRGAIQGGSKEYEYSASENAPNYVCGNDPPMILSDDSAFYRMLDYSYSFLFAVLSAPTWWHSDDTDLAAEHLPARVLSVR
jgi:hypothetical protein